MDSRRDTRLLSCSLCLSNGVQVVTKISHYVNHLRVFHAHQPNFKVTCGIDGCVRNFTNIGMFKNHVSLVHYDTLPAFSDPSDDSSINPASSVAEANVQADSNYAQNDVIFEADSVARCSSVS